jgi:hypothetical protein
MKMKSVGITTLALTPIVSLAILTSNKAKTPSGKLAAFTKTWKPTGRLVLKSYIPSLL